MRDRRDLILRRIGHKNTLVRISITTATVAVNRKDRAFEAITKLCKMEEKIVCVPRSGTRIVAARLVCNKISAAITIGNLSVLAPDSTCQAQ